MSLRSDLAAFVKRQQILGAKIVPIEPLERMLAKPQRDWDPWVMPCIAIGGVVALAMIGVIIALVVTP